MYIHLQVTSIVEYVDIKARNCFFKGATLSIIKYVTKFIHHSVRNKIINRGFTATECLQFKQWEDWDHIIKCSTLRNERKVFIMTLHNKLTKSVNRDDIKL